jgi:hypothetical protein
MRGDALVDLRHLFRADDATRAGFRYESIDRPAPAPISEAATLSA